MQKTYPVIDKQTKQVVKTFVSRKRAQIWADKMDQQHGSIRYIVNFLGKE